MKNTKITYEKLIESLETKEKDLEWNLFMVKEIKESIIEAYKNGELKIKTEGKVLE